MKSRTLPLALLAMTFTVGVAQAAEDAKEKLILLDKQWGEATVKGDTETVASLLADELLSVDDQGVTGKAEQLNAEPQPETPYVAGDYKVVFVDDTTAVMTHTVEGSQPHRSFHVWAKRDGAWKVVATMSMPIAK